MKIPFVDLKLQYQNIKTEIDHAIADVIADTAFVGGASNKYVAKFEKEFADFLGLKHVVSCANGTDSLELLLEAYKIGSSDEVIVPALSWISTSESVGRVGAKPVFVDVCEDTLLMDLKKLEQVLTKNTKAIVPVHLYGNAVDMPTLMTFAKKHKLIVIEDCAQAHGARYNEQLVGTFGDAASFSFYPGKNLGAYGDAGCIATNNGEIADKCRMIANHGQLQKHNHLVEGRNSRMDGLHAAVLSVKLKYLNDWNASRIKNAEALDKLLAGSSYSCPTKNRNAKHVYHLYVIRHTKRDELKQYLAERQIETAIHYPTALPMLKAYSKYGYYTSDFPVACSQTRDILSIPMYPELKQEQIHFLAEVLLNFGK